MEPDDLLCSRNAPGFVCLVGWSFWSVWFFLMNFRSDQPDKPDRRDRPDEPAFVGRAQWKINQPPSLERNEQAWREHVYRSMRAVKGSLGHSPRVRHSELEKRRSKTFRWNTCTPEPQHLASTACQVVSKSVSSKGERLLRE